MLEYFFGGVYLYCVKCSEKVRISYKSTDDVTQHIWGMEKTLTINNDAYKKTHEPFFLEKKATELQ